MLKPLLNIININVFLITLEILISQINEVQQKEKVAIVIKYLNFKIYFTIRWCFFICKIICIMNFQGTSIFVNMYSK